MGKVANWSVDAEGATLLEASRASNSRLSLTKPKRLITVQCLEIANETVIDSGTKVKGHGKLAVRN
jgi:hypothetical protein